MKCRWQKLKVIVMVAFCIVFCKTTAEAAEILPTTVTEPSEGCVLLGLEGSFIADADAALKRINQIRLEACKEGIKNPATGKPLKKSDYVPIKWSNDMEYIARIRAAEGAVYLDHTRPNGKSCFSVSSPKGKSSRGEVLAWNYSDSVVDGINQWYEEKTDWVNNTGGVTGHYTAMINPHNTYVGIATFYSEDTYFPNCTSGEFSSKKGLDGKKMPGVKDCIQMIELKKSALSDVAVSGAATLEIGKDSRFAYRQNAVFSGVRKTTTGLVSFGDVAWKSSKPSVATVNENGIVTGISEGSTKITATSNGKSASITINVLPSIEGKAFLRLTKEKFTYNGRSQYPSIYVLDENGSSIPFDRFELDYPHSCTNVGKYTIKVHFLKKYAGTLSTSFTIVPKGSSLTSISTKKKAITVKWKKQLKQTTGYQLQYTKDKKFKSSVKTVSIGKNTTVSKKISKLQKGKNYYVRIRTYKKVKGKNYYSSWSKTKSIKVE